MQYGPWRGLHFLPTSSLHFFHRLFLSCRFVTPVCPSVRLAVLQRSALDISLPLPMQPASFLSPLFLAARIHDDADGFLTIEASPNCRLSIFHRHCSLSLSPSWQPSRRTRLELNPRLPKPTLSQFSHRNVSAVSRQSVVLLQKPHNNSVVMFKEKLRKCTFSSSIIINSNFPLIIFLCYDGCSAVRA